MIREVALTLAATGLCAAPAALVGATIVGVREYRQRRRATPAITTIEEIIMSRSEQIIWTDDDPFAHETEFQGSLVAEARRWLRQRFYGREASNCPCCGQTVRRYARTINATMVSTLTWIASRPDGATPRQAVSQSKGSGDYAKLKHWGLLQLSSGKWRATEAGRAFIRGQTTVPRYMYIYDQRVLGQSEERVDVHACAGRVIEVVADGGSGGRLGNQMAQ